MIRAALIGFALALVFFALATLLTPICTPFLALLLGGGVGYLAAHFDTPSSADTASGKGALAGALAAAGGLIGQMSAVVVTGVLVGAEMVNELMAQFGFDAPEMTSAQYWASLLGVNFACSLLNIGLMAITGAIGGYIWYSRLGKQRGAESYEP